MAVPGDATRWLLAHRVVHPVQREFDCAPPPVCATVRGSRHPVSGHFVGDTFPHQLVGEAGSLWHDGVGYALMVTSGVTDGIRWNRDEYANRLAARASAVVNCQSALA